MANGSITARLTRRARRAGAGMASMVRSLCGSAAGAQRRGSTIVLVVSSLALFAVITVAYVGLGIGDRRTGSVTLATAQVDDVAHTVRNYLVDVIGRDATAVFVEQGPRNTLRITREAWDYPWTDPQQVSDSRITSRGGRPAVRFDPAGTMPRSMVEQARRGQVRWGEPFGASDPWLASTEPCWLPDISGSLPTPSDPYYLDLTSWWQISNFAPDGRFVNLYALRNNFDAAPGIRTGEMSEHLGLLDDRGRWQGTRHDTIHGERADKNIPAHWTMFQEGAARPVGPGLDSSGRLLGPGEAAYAPYTWVDADGDGILDSRWFELVDAYEAGNIISLLPRDNRWRWFVAARAIDLSSLVNVNTARDVSQNGSPTWSRPIGITPADIDLLRLLTLEDEFALNPNSTGYGDIHQPVGGGLAVYSDYSDDFDEADELGRLAYQAIKEGARSGVIPPAGTPLTPDAISAADREAHYLRSGAANPGGARWDRQRRLVNSAAFSIQDLVELLTYHGVNDSATISRLERMAGGRDLTNPRQQGYSPLRDNRPLDVERMADVGNPVSPAPDGQIDPERLALMAMDPRRRLTTLSGATHRRSSNVPYSNPRDVPTVIANIYADDAPAKAHPRAVLDLGSEPPLASAGTVVDRAPLFFAYAQALLPGAGETDAWTRNEHRTMFYGHDPVFALRAAAHLTANRIDSWDTHPDGEKPTALTLRIRQGVSLEGAPDFPWWDASTSTPGGDIYPGRLDLDPGDAGGLLPTDSAVSDAVNVYGIEPQPFVIQASTFTMYTDTPFDQGGDKEWTDDPGGGVPGMGISIPGPATIDGSVSSSNADFLFQAVAFQLTNPFEESISLEDYRIEFGVRGVQPGEDGYRLLDADTELPVTLAPGETVVLYYLSQPKERIETRMTSSAFDSTIIFMDKVNEWIDHQFRGGAAAEGMMRVVELAREDQGPTELDLDLLAGAHGSDNQANRVVRLWRTLKAPSDGQHRMLVDRLRDPAPEGARPTLDRRLPTGQNVINGTSVGPPPNPDDEGYSLTMWGTIRRPEDPRAVAGAVENPLPLGGLPAWCIEARFGEGRGGELNIAETDDINPQSLSKGDFDPMTSDNGEKRLDSLVQRQTGGTSGSGGTPQRLDDNLSLEPWAKSTGESRALTAAKQRDQLPYWSSGAAGLDPELHIGPQGGTPPTAPRPLRLGDMLMAMAVGPVEDPQDPRFVAASDRPEEKWTTLSESLALALGYDETPDLSGGEPDPTVMRPTTTGPTPQLWRKTDRGFLRLDDFTAFYDDNTNGVYDPGVDLLLGDGIPMALSILDVFRPSFGNDDSEQFGSLTNPAVGVININTAPPSVLRALGLLSPTATDLLGGQAGRDWLVGSPHGPESDIVATILAYRDKTLVYPRDLSGATPQAIAFMSSASSSGPGDPQDVDGRAEFIDNERFTRGEPLPVREQPGFRSVGEIMLARQRDSSGSAGPHDIDWLAFTGAMTTEGVESFQYGDTASRMADRLDRDYDEKLAIFNSIASSISVRSDLYAVWFVLHGYQREDVEGLGPDDPLLPTVAKRFLIIVDRSNVTTEGERPRILHFQELPL